MNMKKIYVTIFAAAALLLASSCVKEVISTQGHNLGVKTVGAGAGNFSALVTTTGVWSVSSSEEWLHVSSQYHKGECAISVSYDSNESTEAVHRFNRKGYVLISTYDKATADTIHVRQMGLEPLIVLPEEFDAAAGSLCRVPLVTNLSDSQRPFVQCKSQGPHIGDAVWSSDGEAVEFRTAADASGETVLTVSFTDAWGQIYSDECSIRFQEGE